MSGKSSLIYLTTRKTSLLPVLSLLTLLLIFSSVPVPGSFTVEPRKIPISISAGESYSDVFIVENTGDGTITIAVSVADWDMDEKGRIQFSQAGSLPRSLAQWIDFPPQRFVLRPGQSKSVNYDISIPEGEKRSHWGVVLVRELPDQEESASSLSIHVALQYAISVYQKDPAATKEGSISGFFVYNTENDLPGFEIRFKNNGEAFLYPEGKIEIRDACGEVFDTLEVAPFLVLPYRTRGVKFNYSTSLDPGEYVAVVLLDFDGQFLVAAQNPFEVK